jgi:cobalt/nickel transport system permease protein
MKNFSSKVNEIYSLEQFSSMDTVIHRLHPAVKITTTFIYIFVVVSFDRYAFTRMVPYIFYPVLIMALAEIPYSLILSRLLLALPFTMFAGLSNILFDQTILFRIYGVGISFGVVSFVTLVFRALLCVAAILILVATTPFSSLTGQLRRMKIPESFIVLFEMTYRYIGSLFEETTIMITAYQLRRNSRKGIDMKHMGSFAGQLLIRSFDRAQQVYDAMKCRGYGLYARHMKRIRLTMMDYGFLVIACGLPLLFRIVDVSQAIQQILPGART